MMFKHWLLHSCTSKFKAEFAVFLCRERTPLHLVWHMGRTSEGSTFVHSWLPIIPSPWTLVASNPAANTHIHTQWLSCQMVKARWRGLLNSWQHWGPISYNMAHQHTEANAQRHGESTWNQPGKTADTREWTCQYKQGHARKLCARWSFCMFEWVLRLIDASDRERKKEQEMKETERSEARKWGERVQGGRLWTMVSNRRTLVQWWMLPFNNHSFWGGKERRCFMLAVPGPVPASVSLRHGDKWLSHCTFIRTCATDKCTAEDQTHTYSLYCVDCSVSKWIQIQYSTCRMWSSKKPTWKMVN